MFDGSVTIEIGIMDATKGWLEPVRGCKLPVKVGKDMTTDEFRVITFRLRSVFWGVGKLRTSLSWYQTCVPYTWYRWAIYCWANPSGQKYSKIVSEVKTSMNGLRKPSGQKYFKIVSEVDTKINELSNPSGQN